MALAAQRLAQGGLLAMPTETVYGLAARADDDEAVARIYRAKGRPVGHPLIVHVGEPEAALAFASHTPALAQALIDAFWPGPLTLILPRRQGVAQVAAGGLPSVGLRCPSHPVAQALLSECAGLGVLGLAAPSANRFGRVSPTQAAHVVSEFEGRGQGLDEVWVLDGGACEVGIESAIVDCCGPQPMLLRPGALTLEQLQHVCGQPLLWSKPEAPLAQAARAPGTLLSHYAPQARVRLMEASQLQEALGQWQQASSPRQPMAIYARESAALTLTASSDVPVLRMPEEAAAAAHALFADLRTMDEWGVAQIWVHMPPPGSAWDGVRDRLLRAAA